MAKLALSPLLLAIGCLFCGLYGIVHDQVTYTISPDYFHALKFLQFEIPDALRNRFGVALVGWYASWWMGLFIGVPVLAVALIMPDRRTYIIHSLAAFAAVAVTALAIGLIGFAYAFIIIRSPADFDWVYLPTRVTDKVNFARVGIMHNFTYLGGFLGILTACTYLVGVRRRLSRKST